ncbi:L-threonylcarbamoyladenylate synthase [Marininema halotolerans]|uniref:Threonylcarbamoyl-AMP synthase n=1 Tax=Marininema halotolerans TaxID=1155944 RepID=A0A1I6P3U3_9BACL|nr:L-threonylcarbamoyladenylate synthase [Marininema halotolerans]SFS34811.1 L-threonylcarbamoyladenylate synthase [Marininema halotolerans]
MKTKLWRVNEQWDEAKLLDDPSIQEAAALIQQGRLVAFPTETVYGLGANARSGEAVTSIFTAKGRPSDNPLIVHIADTSALDDWAEMPSQGTTLLQRFWPGPLTLVIRHKGTLAQETTAGLTTVGVRIPSHPVARALLRCAAVPVAAPSANRSGRPSPTTAEHVWQDLAGRIDGIVDGGMTGVGVESTVVDVTGEVPVLLRPGGITLDQLRSVVGEVQVDPGLEREGEVPRSPGMKYRHYAPHGQMWLVAGSGDKQRTKVKQLANEAIQQGKRVAILTTVENKDAYPTGHVLSLGSRENPASVAQGLYAALRTCDDIGVDIIYAEAFPVEGLYHSVMNRLLKAAEGRIIID